MLRGSRAIGIGQDAVRLLVRAVVIVQVSWEKQKQIIGLLSWCSKNYRWTRTYIVMGWIVPKMKFTVFLRFLFFRFKDRKDISLYSKMIWTSFT
jgi:hypothetical protein